MIDISNFTTITQEQAIALCHQETTQPALIALFSVMIFLFLIFGLMFIRKNRDKLWLILVYTFVIGGSVFLALFFLPNTMQDFYTFFKSLFS